MAAAVKHVKRKDLPVGDILKEEIEAYQKDIVVVATEGSKKRRAEDDAGDKPAGDEEKATTSTPPSDELQRQKKSSLAADDLIPGLVGTHEHQNLFEDDGENKQQLGVERGANIKVSFAQVVGGKGGKKTKISPEEE